MEHAVVHAEFHMTVIHGSFHGAGKADPQAFQIISVRIPVIQKGMGELNLITPSPHGHPKDERDFLLSVLLIFMDTMDFYHTVHRSLFFHADFFDDPPVLFLQTQDTLLTVLWLFQQKYRLGMVGPEGSVNGKITDQVFSSFGNRHLDPARIQIPLIFLFRQMNCLFFLICSLFNTDPFSHLTAVRSMGRPFDRAIRPKCRNSRLC